MAYKMKAIVLLLFLLGCIALPSFAQNTKGDRPTSSRDSRFVKGDKNKKNIRKGGRQNKKSLRPGRTGRVRPRSASGRNANLFSQNNRFVNNPSKQPDEGGEGRSARRAGRNRSIATRSQSNRIRNVYPQRGRFVNNPSPQPRDNVQRAVSNKPALTRLRKLQGREPGPSRTPRIIPRSASRSYQPGKSINIVARYPRPKRRGEKAYTRDIAGRRIRQKNYQTRTPQIVTAAPSSSRSASGKKRSGDGPSQRPRSISGAMKKVHPQSGRFVNNPSKTPRSVERAESNSVALRRLDRLQSDKSPKRRGRILSPRSASGSFIQHRSTNTWAQFPRPKKRGERAVTTDIAGKRLRTKNYESPRREIIQPTFKPYQNRRRVGERAYKGPAAGTHQTATRTGKSWSGDIAGRRIRGSKDPKSPSVGKQRGGYLSSSNKRRVTLDPVLGKPPGARALSGLDRFRGRLRNRRFFGDQGESFSGVFRSRRPAKGGGSVSGRLWNNQSSPLPPRGPGETGGGLFRGNIKARVPGKGGGSVSGRLWNNSGVAIAPRKPGVTGSALYQGNLKSRRPAKGGGSVSGKLWNNDGGAIVKGPPLDSRPGTFQGNIKRSPFRKGGGSVSGRLWNNSERSIAAKTPPARARQINGFPGKLRLFETRPGFLDQGEEYTGHIKAKRPAKGGGSVSGRLWNNNNAAIAVRTPKGDSRQIGAFQGTLKARRPLKGGGSVSGKLWNNDETPLVGTPPGGSLKIARYQGNIKARRPAKGGGSVSGKLWNNDERPIEVRTPKKEEDYNTSGNIRLSRRHYVKNPNASELALRKERPSSATYRQGDLQVRVRRYDYVRNSSSSKDALKIREPGKAFARATDFQGNIKMQKFKLFENRNLHPDARFIRTNKNNVDEEKDLFTNFRLWWARLFRKNETQPDHLKDKGKRPRYDKGEAGLWYD